MGVFDRLFGRRPQTGRGTGSTASSAPATQPAVPTVGTGPADAREDGGVISDTTPAVGEDRGQSQTPTTEDREAAPMADEVGEDAPARGPGAASGPMSTQAMTVPQLRAHARSLGLSGYSRMSKAELVEAIARAE
jgi:hypothetical protein